MRMKKLEVALQGQDVGRNDRKWFPFWLRKYAALCVQETGQPPAVEREVVIAFLHRRRLNGRPAWQRLQAVRAVAFYRSGVRRRGEPVLKELCDRLAGLARSERQEQGPGQWRAESSDVSAAGVEGAGRIDANEPEAVSGIAVARPVDAWRSR